MSAVLRRWRDRHLLLRPGRWSLRNQLVASTLALMTAVSLAVGVVSVLALDSFLVDRLDDQVSAAEDRLRGPAPEGGEMPIGPGRPVDGGRGPAGQGEGTLLGLVIEGAAEATVVGRSGTLEQLDAGDAAPLAAVPVERPPQTVSLGDRGSYRVRVRSGPNGTALITGLPLSPARDTVLRLAGIITVVSVLGLMAAALLGLWLVRRALRPLQRVAGTARHVAELPLDRGEVALAVRVPASQTDTRTEVGQVGAALNRMLENVASALTARQASETRVRQFVADASHELRTPLAVIRGYAELTRRQTEPVPDDVAHAMRRVESEALRMTGLVEDLLLLARLDTGRPVEREDVDLSSLLVEAVRDAHVAGPDHRFQLALPDEPVVVTGDRDRLHQAVTNLLTNARVHTPPGTSVVVGLARDAGGAQLEVADDGPGIPPALLPEVFERFARGDTSRSRAAGSTGLGLAIVAAVVAAHDGEVAVTSRPGLTSFRVRLPSRPAARPQPAAPGSTV